MQSPPFLQSPSLSGTSSLSSGSPIDYPSLHVVHCHCSLGQSGFHPKVASHVIIFSTACCPSSQYIHACLLSHPPVPISCLTALLSLVSPLRHQIQPCLTLVNLKGLSITRGSSGEEAERLKSEIKSPSCLTRWSLTSSQMTWGWRRRYSCPRSSRCHLTYLLTCFKSCQQQVPNRQE